MAYTAWTASTAFAVGDVRRATTQQGTGFVFRCIVAGTSSGSEPDWPKVLYKTDGSSNDEGYVVDGTVTWAAVSAVSEELQKLAPSAVIELFQLQLVSGLHYDPASPPATTTYYFHAGTNELSGDLVWAGTTYSRFPVQAEGFEYSGTGQLPTPSFTAANLNGLLSLALIDVNVYTPGNDLIKAKVTRIRTLSRYLDASNFTGGSNPTADPQAEFPREVYYISRKTAETRDTISWDLASIFDMQGVRGPKRQAIHMCQWKYKSAECSYSPKPTFLTGTCGVVGSQIYITVDFSSWVGVLSVGDPVNIQFSGFPSYSGAYIIEDFSGSTIKVAAPNSSINGSCSLTTWIDTNDQPVYSASSDQCGKRLTSCEARFGTNKTLPFGGFPGVGQFQ